MMNEQQDRLRPHPEERFRSTQHSINLGEAAERLLAEPLPASRKHRQQTLYQHHRLTVALFTFEQAAHLPQHVAAGVVTIHVLQGRLKVTAEQQVHELAADQLLMLAPGVQHDVYAEAPSRMLLTVCLEPSG